MYLVDIAGHRQLPCPLPNYDSYAESGQSNVGFIAFRDALVLECEVGFGRKANVQADRPTLPPGEIPPLFRMIRSNGAEPPVEISFKRRLNSGLKFGLPI